MHTSSSDDEQLKNFAAVDASESQRLKVTPPGGDVRYPTSEKKPADENCSEVFPAMPQLIHSGRPTFRHQTAAGHVSVKDVKRTRSRSPYVVVAIAVGAFSLAIFSALRCIPLAEDVILGQASAIIGIRPLAVEEFKSVWHNDPANVGVLICWANTRAVFDKKDALNWYADCIAINPTYASCYLNRGLDYYNLGDDDKALADYSKALELNSEYALVYSNRSAIYRKRHHFEAELADLNKAIKFNPKNSTFYFNRGLAHHDLRQFGEAARDLEYAESLGLKNLVVDAELEAVREKKPAPPVNEGAPINLGNPVTFIFTLLATVVLLVSIFAARTGKFGHPMTTLASKYPMTASASTYTLKRTSYFDMGYRLDSFLLAFDHVGIVLRLESSMFKDAIWQTALIPWGAIDSVTDATYWLALVRIVKLKDGRVLMFSRAELDGVENFFPVTKIV